MKRTVVRIIAFMISMTLCIGMYSAAASAETQTESLAENGALSIPLTVQERSGAEVKDYFFRRGIAIEKGLLWSSENICITEDGKAIPSAAEVLETYDDGSIRWLLVTGTISLRANELKRLVVTNGESKRSTTTYEMTESYIKVDSEKIDFTLGKSGIESLKYNGKEMLSKDGINLYVTVGGKTSYMSATDFEVIKNEGTYSKFKVSGVLRSDVTGEIVITISDGTSKIQIDHRIIAKDNVLVESTGLKIGAQYKNGEGAIINSDFLDLGSMQLATYDVTRFDGATNLPGTTGYVAENGYTLFAPLVHGKGYTYFDGIARTCHLYITFDGDGENMCKMLSSPPGVFASAEQYKKAGMILSTTVSPVVQDFIEKLNLGYKRSVANFVAGGLADYDKYTDHTVITINIPGEVEYNYGMGYMQTGNEDLWRQMFDMSEIRCDVAVYNGMHEDLQGVMRARVQYVTNGTSFFQSHGYYSDEGGLYMTYVLSGDEYVYETFKKCIYKTLEDSYARTTNGTNYVEYWYWHSGDSSPRSVPTKGSFIESRGMIRVRTFYLAYRLFKDVRFRDAAYAGVLWAKNAQLDSGEFSQVTQHNGQETYQTIKEGLPTQYPIKNYVNMMGFRGVSELLDFEENEMALDVVLKYSDALCRQGENFGPVLMNPHSDPDTYIANEDGSRSTDCRANILAVDVLCTAFEHTGDEKYLEWICKFLEAYIASSYQGMGAVLWDKGYTKDWGFGWGGEIQRNTSFLRTSDNLSLLFETHREQIEAMGFEHLALVFTEGAESLGEEGKSNIPFPHATQNVYELNGDKSIFLMSHQPKGCSDDDENWVQDVKVTFNEMRLWQGVTNVLENACSVILSKKIDFKEMICGMQRPIYVDDFAGRAEVEIKEYSKERIEVAFKGDFEAEITVKDGNFKISDAEGYNVDVAYRNGESVLTLTPGGSVKPVNNAITLKINGKGKVLDQVGGSILYNTGLKNLDPNAPLSAEEIKNVVHEVYGVDIDFEGETPTWGEFSKELVGAIGVSDKWILENAGLNVVIEREENPNLTDEESVMYAAQALDVVYNGETLSSDVKLASNFINGTTVTWESTRPDILSGDGVLYRQNVDCDSLTLTATIKKGSAAKTKDFVIPLDRNVDVTIEFGLSYNKEYNMQSLLPQKGTFEITYTLFTTKDKMDAIVSVGSSETLINGNGKIPYCVRFGLSGLIDAYSGTIYKAEKTLKYEKGKNYKVRMVVNLDTDTYDAYVTPEGDDEVLIAKDYKRRAASTYSSTIDQIWAWSNGGGLEIKDISSLMPRKTEAADVLIEDHAGNRFDPYLPLAGYSFPYSSGSGKVINWQTIRSRAKIDGQYATVYIGAERLTPLNMSLMEVLRESRIVRTDVKETDFVTPASLARPISLKR